MLLYIHGFGKTINSEKSKVLKSYFGENIIISDHSFVPDIAVAELEKMVEENNIEGVIGSSLGGFYATYLSAKYGLKAVVSNPSVQPSVTTKDYLGKRELEDGSIFVWKQEYMNMFEKFKVEKPCVKNFFILLQKGDDVLDYRMAQNYYDGAKMIVQDGGNHSFVGYEEFFEEMKEFLYE